MGPTINVLEQCNKEKQLTHLPILFCAKKHEKYVYMVMELLGKNLRDFKTAYTKDLLLEGDWSRIGLQILHAVKSMHDRRFVHRDLKPANIIFGYQSNMAKFRTIHVLDFGLARGYAFYKDGQWTARKARLRIDFRGTFRCASPNMRRDEHEYKHHKKRLREALDPNLVVAEDSDERFCKNKAFEVIDPIAIETVLFTYPRQRCFGDSEVNGDGSFTPKPRGLLMGILLGASDQRSFEETAREEASTGIYLPTSFANASICRKKAEQKKTPSTPLLAPKEFKQWSRSLIEIRNLRKVAYFGNQPVLHGAVTVKLTFSHANAYTGVVVALSAQNYTLV
ncbi:unnamed protein product, partial [Mesorhabditis belari]|uniref:non-specific serine/threonine protein kinase n=1 Tax=Mesorhabditis belari TaxID=2138241 RepID=A0AAF3JBS6_9BILA